MPYSKDIEEFLEQLYKEHKNVEKEQIVTNKGLDFSNIDQEIMNAKIHLGKFVNALLTNEEFEKNKVITVERISDE